MSTTILLSGKWWWSFLWRRYIKKVLVINVVFFFFGQGECLYIYMLILVLRDFGGDNLNVYYDPIRW